MQSKYYLPEYEFTGTVITGVDETESQHVGSISFEVDGVQETARMEAGHCKRITQNFINGAFPSIKIVPGTKVKFKCKRYLKEKILAYDVRAI